MGPLAVSGVSCLSQPSRRDNVRLVSRPGYVDRRGNNQSRARRREWLLVTFDPELGDDRARCRLALDGRCLEVVDAATLSVDRIEPGGSYARGNIQPACQPCQDLQGYLLGRGAVMEPLLAAYRDARDARLALRESGAIVPAGAVAGTAGADVAYYQLSDEEFAALHPPVLWRDWLLEHAGTLSLT